MSAIDDLVDWLIDGAQAPPVRRSVTAPRHMISFASTFSARAGVIAAGLACAIGCGAEHGGSPSDATARTVEPNDPSIAMRVPHIDELAWYAELAKKRPDLVADVTVLGTCFHALTLKPEYRARLLAGTETPDQIVQTEYSAASKDADARWAKNLQDGELAYCNGSFVGGCAQLCTTTCAACPRNDLHIGSANAGPLPIWYPAGYGLCSYVGYKQGPNTKIIDSRGYDWKLLFQLSDHVTQLTSDSYQRFSRALGEAGYHGDSKTPMIAGWARFQYNTLIVHAHSRADASIAERIAISTFGPALVGYSRGADVQTAQTGGKAAAWHDYLCQVHGDTSQLPSDILAFIRFED